MTDEDIAKATLRGFGRMVLGPSLLALLLLDIYLGYSIIADGVFWARLYHTQCLLRPDQWLDDGGLICWLLRQFQPGGGIASLILSNS